MSVRPRLLYLCTRFPWPLDRGDRVRSYHLLEQFSRHADITLVSFCEGDPVTAPVDRLLPLCARVEVIPLSRRRSRLNMALNLAGTLPFQVAYYRSEIMDRLVDRLVKERFDLAFGWLFRMFPYLDRFTKSRRVLDLADSLSLNLRRAIPVKPAWKQPAFREEQKRVHAYEAMTLGRVEEGWVVSDVDRRDLLSRAPGASIEVVPNGVSTEWGLSGQETPKRDSVIFLGNLTVGHNIDTVRHLVDDIWPLVRARRPEATLDLVGTFGPALAPLNGRNGVRLHGFVEDLTPLLREARLTVAPLRYGAGIQNKVVEAMAAGLPAVVTPIVNEPIGAEPGREIVVAEAPDAMAGEILKLFDDDRGARAMGLEASRFVRARYSWDAAGRRIAALLDLSPAATSTKRRS